MDLDVIKSSSLRITRYEVRMLLHMAFKSRLPFQEGWRPADAFIMEKASRKSLQPTSPCIRDNEHRVIQGYIRVIFGLYRDIRGIMEKKMEATIYIRVWGLGLRKMTCRHQLL